MESKFRLEEAGVQHIALAVQICEEMSSSAKVRGTGIARRSPQHIIQKMLDQHAIIAFDDSGEWAGFCYVQVWQNGEFVSNSGLIIAPKFRKQGLGRAIKKRTFDLARKKYPMAKVFGLTTSSAVMKINTELAYQPVIYAEIPQEPAFWSACGSCVNHEILIKKEHRNCLCTAMVFDPNSNKQNYSLTNIHEQQESHISI
jgi:hypothetical protein